MQVPTGYFPWICIQHRLKVFDVPVDHLSGAPILADYFMKTFGDEEFVVVAPDVGGVARARKFAQKLDASPLAIIDKRRQAANECEIMNIIGDVKENTA